MFALRSYQQKAIDLTYDYLRLEDGNPCIVIPTGGGKSIIIAELCRNALTSWPETRILMIVHTRELIKQNAEKLLAMWPNAPLAIYSAGLGQKNTDAITYAGIQSARGKADLFGHRDLLLVDEAHLISHKEEGGYRTLINDLLKINPEMRVIGFTATPFRLGHGKITDGDAIFDELIEPVTIEELQAAGFLCRLRSRVTDQKLTTEGVHKRGGEYIESELQAVVDTTTSNTGVVRDLIKYGEDRRHWLIFCTGVDHSLHIRDELIANGISAATVTGITSLQDRDRIIGDFKAGRIRALTNANVLTTGFDFPDIDLIGMMRPTMSPVLYVQQAGRGSRPKSHAKDCLVLDFAGVVAQHGPITQVLAPEKAQEGGEAPTKECPQCGEICHAAARHCLNVDCGYEFPIKEKPAPTLHDDDIQGNGIQESEVYSWYWDVRTSKAGNRMVVITYGLGIGDCIHEYLLPWNQGFAGKKGIDTLNDIAQKCGLGVVPNDTEAFQNCRPPSTIKYKMEGKFPRIIDRTWKLPELEEVPF